MEANTEIVTDGNQDFEEPSLICMQPLAVPHGQAKSLKSTPGAANVHGARPSNFYTPVSGTAGNKPTIGVGEDNRKARFRGKKWQEVVLPVCRNYLASSRK
jgi:hypothetical protein